MADEALLKFASLLRSASRIIKKDPETGALAASVTIHALMLLALSYFSFVPFGTPFGNGIEPGGEENAGVSVNYTPPQSSGKAEAKIQSAVLKTAVTPKNISGTMVLAKSRPVKKPDEKQPKKMAQLRPADTRSPIDVRAQKALSDNDISEKIFPKHEKKSTAAIDIPVEIGKEIGKKLKSADYSDQENASTAEVNAKAINAPDSGDLLTLQKTDVKMIDEEGDLIASAAIGGMARKPSASDAGDEMMSETSQVSSDARPAAGGKGNGKKGGTGAFGSPNGSRRSGIAFEMVENSTYNETPSFLNGPPDITYPKWAQEQGAEGTVMVVLEILPNGEVGSVTKHQSPISDRLAQDLIRQAEMWRFKPIYKNGKALSGSVMVSVDYSLKNK